MLDRVRARSLDRCTVLCNRKECERVHVDLDDFELMPIRPGLRVSFPFAQRDRTASTATVLFELDPGAELPVHTDSAEELLVVVQGTARRASATRSGRIATHQVALVPPMAPHGLRNIGDDGSRARHVLGLDRRLDVAEEGAAPAAYAGAFTGRAPPPAGRRSSRRCRLRGYRPASG